VNKEITWNQQWFKQTGFSASPNFSPNGIIPPAITGLHNGDALKQWFTNGIKHAVGDNTRPVLMDRVSNNFFTSEMLSWDTGINQGYANHSSLTISGHSSATFRQMVTMVST
jgi:hypothetical protein